MKNFILCVMLTLIASSVSAEDVKVSVSEVRDSRTTGQFFAGLEIKLKAMGDNIADARGIRMNVTKAIDDTGRDLLKKDSDKRTEFTKPDENNSGQAEIEIKLKNPSRKAASVSELSGEIVIFAPKKDPNATAEIAAFMTMAGKPVENSALKNAHVEIAIMTKKQFDDFKEKQKKEVKAKEGEIIRELGEAMAKALGALFEGMMEIGENSVILNIADPDSKVIELEFLDAGGGAIKSFSTMKTGDIRVYEFDKPMPPDARLRIFMMTPKSLMKTGFKLTDITLP
ncbi:MAG: hypothetical protein HZC48_07370 [Nitrospirae bacterium]|nr:hypothetical protein [Nitrospirota bacterium]MBI5675627.1 hypothetical protein [Nitrospirota bacterium]